MKKHALYIILSIAAVLSLFIIAATCSFCGIQLDTTPSEESETAGTVGEEDTAAKDTHSTSNGTSAGDQQETAQQDAANSAPEIINIEHNGEDITEMLASEALPIKVGITEEHIFTIIASDRDNDELKFSVEASDGQTDDLHKVGAASAEFLYIPPASIELSGDFEIPKPASITVTAVDTNGDMDTFVINISLSPGVVGVARATLLSADNSNSGYVTQDTGVRTGVILIGDDNANKQLKGYLSFDLSQLYEALESFEIGSATINFTTINKSGDPASISDILDFKAIEYGTLEISDFAPGGERIIEVGTNEFISSGSYKINPAALLDTLIETANENKPFYQIKMGLKSTTNRNGTFDIIEIHPENVTLGVGLISNF